MQATSVDISVGVNASRMYGSVIELELEFESRLKFSLTWIGEKQLEQPFVKDLKQIMLILTRNAQHLTFLTYKWKDSNSFVWWKGLLQKSIRMKIY